jgi:hypothetical protein
MVKSALLSRRVMLRILVGSLVVAAAWVALRVEAPADSPKLATRGDSFIGAERCASCHPGPYKVWKETDPHARAHLSLPPERRADPKCTGCHSPDPGLVHVGVQCESCHGSGRWYSLSFVMKDKPLAKVLGLIEPGRARCLSCHVGHGPRSGSPATFDYDAKVRAFVHWSR